jgi:hypothetical protein
MMLPALPATNRNTCATRSLQSHETWSLQTVPARHDPGDCGQVAGDLAPDPSTSHEDAGRAYAAYGGVYIVASLLWLWAIEGVRPDRWDVAGALICLFGAAVILLGPRTA